MPVQVRKVGRLWRLVESIVGAIARGRTGKALDGGGYTDERTAQRQASAVNAALYRHGR